MNNLYRINDLTEKLKIINIQPIDILIVGNTGAGKSSTINAILENNAVIVGNTCEPETSEISGVKLNDYLRFWDSPGLGDSIQKDKYYSKSLCDFLKQKYILDNKEYGLIDLVLLIIDGSSRDIGTSLKILENDILPNFPSDRILIAINQADIAMKNRHWDNKINCPDSVLLKYLENKSVSIYKRLLGTNISSFIKPIYYSAERGYNIDRLLDLIIDNIPSQKRVLLKK